ncbi:AT-hook motif nuclear-localized protein 10-like [Durio zibethinus]|uniref:AT-hook motif nuclear-localized protein n=1 Tax=Durio zibethinus TaxID=66656 RepID=A0A6P6B9V0_DURZI|nr:AT-hook motif nuclear-localized protein 10-like [Durio zibethinus]
MITDKKIRTKKIVVNYSPRHFADAVPRTNFIQILSCQCRYNCVKLFHILPTSAKRARGRPPGSGKKLQLEALGSSGVGFMPHVIAVKAGEDVSSKIISFSQHGPRAVCILSANGAISNVTLRQPATSGRTVTYEMVASSFIAESRKEYNSAYQMETLSAPPKLAPGGVPTGDTSPPPRGTLSESSGRLRSPLNESPGGCNNNNPQGMSKLPWK